MSDMPRRHRLGASPITIAIIAAVVILGAIALGVSGYRMKPATGTGQAMALAADGAATTPDRSATGNAR